MKCALCNKDVRQHKSERILVTNEGILNVVPAEVKQTMHKRCATHYRVAERLLISSGVVKPKEKEKRLITATWTKSDERNWWTREKYHDNESPKYDIFGKRREW